MMSHQDDNLSQEEINEAWGEWEEQDITQGSEEWVQDQRNKRKEVAKLMEKKQAEEKAKQLERSEQLAISLCVEELQMIVKQITMQQEKAQEIIQELQNKKDLVEYEVREMSEHGELKQVKAEKTQDSNVTSEANEHKPVQGRSLNHPFFASHDSANDTSPTNEEKKSEQNINLSLSPRNGK